MIIFDDRIAQELVAGFSNLLARAFQVAFHFDLQEFAHMHTLDPPVAQVFEGVLDCLPLGINHGFLWRYDDFSFH